MLEYTGRLILPNFIRGKVSPIHCDVNSRRERLREGQRASEVKQTIGTAELVWDHCACQHDRLSGYICLEHTARFDHRVRPMRNDNAILRRIAALLTDNLTVSVRHFEAVDHHQRPDLHVQIAASELQHFGNVGVLEVQPAANLVVFFVEGAASHKNAYRTIHTLIVARQLNWD